MIRIHRASHDDSETISQALCASIRELCSADHRDDPETIARWTANKTPAHIARWIDDSGRSLLLAMRDGGPAGVGCISDEGEILLNYVAPAHRFQGVSRALLDHMEGLIRDRGHRHARLTSTETAHRFYQKAGWVDVSAPEILFGLKGYPMEKALQADNALPWSTLQKFRPATEQDKPFLKTLNQDAYQAVIVEQFGSWDDEFQAQNFEKKWQSQNYRIIERDGRAIGAIWVSEESDHLWLREIQIFSAFRDQGIGTAILQDLMEEAKALNRRLRLRVLIANRAKSLYERLGFQTIGKHEDTHYWMEYLPSTNDQE